MRSSAVVVVALAAVACLASAAPLAFANATAGPDGYRLCVESMQTAADVARAVVAAAPGFDLAVPVSDLGDELVADIHWIVMVQCELTGNAFDPAVLKGARVSVRTAADGTVNLVVVTADGTHQFMWLNLPWEA